MFEKKIQLQKLKKLTEEIERVFPLDKKTKEAFLSVPREEFVPPGLKHLSYKIDPLPIQGDQWISSPLTVAKMTSYLQIDSSVDSILEIGCGSGYQAAILSKLGRRVFSVERIKRLSDDAKKRLQKLQIHNVNIRCDDGQNGWSSFAPFDRILFSATAKDIPPTLFDQLNEGGILLAPLQKNEKQIITKFIKQNGKIKTFEIESCKFVPILSGVER